MLFLLFLLGKLRVMEDILGVVIVLEPIYELLHLRKRLRSEICVVVVGTISRSAERNVQPAASSCRARWKSRSDLCK